MKALQQRIGALEALTIRHGDDDSSYTVDIDGAAPRYWIDGQLATAQEFTRRAPRGGFTVEIGEVVYGNDSGQPTPQLLSTSRRLDLHPRCPAATLARPVSFRGPRVVLVLQRRAWAMRAQVLRAQHPSHGRFGDR